MSVLETCTPHAKLPSPSISVTYPDPPLERIAVFVRPENKHRPTLQLPETLYAAIVSLVVTASTYLRACRVLILASGKEKRERNYLRRAANVLEGGISAN